MKKDYLKPEMISMEIVTNEIIATSPGNTIPVTPEVKPSAADESRGEWGNVWSK